MKKLLTLIITLILVLSIAGCKSPAPDTDLEERVEALESKVALLEETLDNIIPSVGINGQVSYYVNDTEYELALTDYIFLADETDYLDKSKFPDYIFGDDGEYIDVNELGNLLSQKYLGTSSTTITGFQYKIQAYKPINMSNEEYMARLCMMILELSLYDFYTIDSPELYIEIAQGGASYIKVRMSLLVSDKYVLHPALFWNELLDTRIEGFSFNPIEVETFYDNYIASDTFDGNVLGY